MDIIVTQSLGVTLHLPIGITEYQQGMVHLEYMMVGENYKRFVHNPTIINSTDTVTGTITFSIAITSIGLATIEIYSTNFPYENQDLNQDSALSLLGRGSVERIAPVTQLVIYT